MGSVCHGQPQLCLCFQTLGSAPCLFTGTGVAETALGEAAVPVRVPELT